MIKLLSLFSGISNTQIYKQAGNSIAVNVAEALFNELVQAELIDKEI